MFDFLKIQLVEYGVSFLIAPLAVLVVQWFKKYSFWLDSLKAWPKRAFVAVTVSVFVAISNATGVDFGVTAGQESVDFLANLDVSVIKVALGSAAAFAIHAIKKAIKK